MQGAETEKRPKYLLTSDSDNDSASAFKKKMKAEHSIEMNADISDEGVPIATMTGDGTAIQHAPTTTVTGNGTTGATTTAIGNGTTDVTTAVIGNGTSGAGSAMTLTNGPSADNNHDMASHSGGKALDVLGS